MPPPMHNVARPFFASRFCISWSKVTRMRVPDAPIGCPSAIAPPLTLTRSGSQPRSLLTAQACAANASLASTRSRSLANQPAFLRAKREAGIGPVPIIAGSTPAVAQETMRASGFSPRLSASVAVISTIAAAPSLMPDALPAVTVPFLSKAGRSFDRTSTVVPCFGCSSVSTMASPRRVVTLTGTISSLKRPAFCAASALVCRTSSPPARRPRPKRHDLVVETAGFLRRFGLGLRAGGELVLLLAGDLPALRDVLGGVAHVIAVEDVPEAVLDHRIDHLRVA